MIQLNLQHNRLMRYVNGLTPRERTAIFELLAMFSLGLPQVESMLDW